MKRHNSLYKMLILTVILALAAFIAASCSQGGSEEAAEEAAAASNPLTGATEEEGFDPNALNQRIVAFVVENAPDARPQFSMDDPELSPDIVLQGEVEAGITRMLWLWADYNKLPEVIGPMRSARPPYIKFSELFDAVFIHWGQSSSKGDYIGANKIFKWHDVDHINQTQIADEAGLFDRDHTRNVSMEHTGIAYGAKVPAALEEAEVRMEPNEITHLSFSDLSVLSNVKPAKQVRVNYSDKASWERTTWTYNEEDQKYHTANFQNDFSRDNLLILFDDTEYIDKANYKGEVGNTVTYCDYALGGGKGYIVSHGAYKDIEWRVEDNKLILIDVEATKAAQEKAAEAEESEEADSEEEDAGPVEVIASLYPGKTWIGWASANNGGEVVFSDGSGSLDNSETSEAPASADAVE